MIMFLFNITLTDAHLDSIWCSLDGGVTNYTITDNTIFNLTAWTDLPEGEITITFYAQDKARNIGTASIVVVKSIPSGPLIPGYDLFILLGILSFVVIIRKYLYRGDKKKE